MSASRSDVYIVNDSGGFSVMPSSALDRIIADDRNNDHAIVSDHQAFLLMLHGDDSFLCRVVANGTLTPDEDAEWLARATWRLSIPCGKLIVSGGFDPSVLADWHDGDHVFNNAVHAIDVPPGDYVVDIYTHRATISGRFIDSIWPTPLGAWFRAEHPGRPFPGRMVEELKISPFTADAVLSPLPEDGWFEPETGVRVPARCPLGLPTDITEPD